MAVKWDPKAKPNKIVQTEREAAIMETSGSREERIKRQETERST
jgi:hypothetical protein